MELVFRILIDSESDIHHAVYRACAEVRELNFDQIKLSKLKTSISELGYNIIKYAKNGTLTGYVLKEPRTGIKIIAADKGPGIENVEIAMQDHFSTSGTLGLGLPGVRRMMDFFQIISAPGNGTEVSFVLFG